jgi:hypothetical protein
MTSGNTPNRDHTESLRRLLRRRGRRNKPGANPKTTVKTWAEYSNVEYTPTGDSSRPNLIVGLAIGALLIFGFPLSFALLQSDEIAGVGDMPGWLGWFFAAMFGRAGLIIRLAPVLLVVQSVRAALESRADRLHQTRMAPGDSAGVAGIAAAEDAAERNSG